MPLAPPVTSTRFPFRPRTSVSPCVDQIGDQSRPAGLVRRAQADASVAVEIFVKKNQVTPMRILLKFFIVAIHGTRTVATTRKNPNQAAGKLIGHFRQRTLAICSFDFET